MKKRSILFLSITCFVLSGFLICLALREVSAYIKAEVVYQKIREDNVENTDSRKTDPIDRVIDWINLQNINPEIKGWIYIPGTHVDYPVCQGKDKNYYLKHNAERKYNILGSIFLSPESETDFSDMHTIIYGHNMRSGRMFGDLSEYNSEEFRNIHPDIYVYTPDKSSRYEVFNAFSCLSNSDTYMTGFQNGSIEYKNWINIMIRKCSYSIIRCPDPVDHIITLSTCSDNGNKKLRFTVQGVLQEEREKTR